MTLTWTTFLIVCPLVFLAGFVDAIGGGGGLISLPAYLMAGLPSHMAVATNKFSSTCGTLVSTARYCLKGYADWKLGIPGMIAAVLGAQVGARIALTVSDEVFKIVLLVLLPVIAIYVLLKKDLKNKDSAPMPFKKQLALLVPLTFLIGMYDGFYGPGTGTFLILIYTGLIRMDVLTASANMKLANLASNISALLIFLSEGLVLLPLGLAAAAFSIGGHYLGAGLAIKNGAKIVRYIILGVIALLFLRLIAEQFGLL